MISISMTGLMAMDPGRTTRVCPTELMATDLGLMELPDGTEIFYTSGNPGPGDAFPGRFSANHAEGHAAADMVNNDITEATITINNIEGPCEVCRLGADDAGAANSIGSILGPDRKLHVEWWSGSEWEVLTINGF